MGVSLTRVGHVVGSPTAGSRGLRHVTVGLGWDVRSTVGMNFDLDVSAIACGVTGTVLSAAHFVFFHNLTLADGTIVHSGDNRTGEGDEEVITVDLNAMAYEVNRIVFPVSIYDGEARGQCFGQVRNAYIRIVNDTDNTELARYDLSEDAAIETAIVFAELYRDGAQWRFRALGQGCAGGLPAIAAAYGVNV